MSAAKPAYTYRNVMESLVVEEVERQMMSLPPKVLQYFNKTEAIAYALNRLPPLYATSERGWEQQRAKASREMQLQITAAVRQALVAVQRDPIRSNSPLRLDEDRDADEALQGLKELLKTDDLSWHNVVDTVERMLIRTARGEIAWRKRGSTVSEGQGWQDNRYIL
ncbi:Late competence development protein ComFB [Leptolyngbyaceae cyanobacterium JSC-12]|nr:Late competence development protein ComFB [Leptolyngbyaceae cyanobacterium JSC-12]